jgi:hypothetical protein
MLPMGHGGSVGSLLDRLSFVYVLIFQPHLTIRAKYILNNGSSTTTIKLLETNGFHFRN